MSLNLTGSCIIHLSDETWNCGDASAFEIGGDCSKLFVLVAQRRRICRSDGLEPSSCPAGVCLFSGGSWMHAGGPDLWTPSTLLLNETRSRMHTALGAAVVVAVCGCLQTLPPSPLSRSPPQNIPSAIIRIQREPASAWLLWTKVVLMEFELAAAETRTELNCNGS